MGWNWQEGLVLVAILGALAYLGRRAWRSFGAKSGAGGGCATGGCGSCPAGSREPGAGAGAVVGIGRIERAPASPTRRPG